jgi:uncharacterized protein YutD
MIVETTVGEYELIKNYRDGFDIVQFQERYVDVAFDRYTYLVGDVSSGILRIKGFSQDPKSVNSYKFITDYLNESCNMNCGYFILRRIKIETEKIVHEPKEQTTTETAPKKKKPRKPKRKAGESNGRNENPSGVINT